MAQDGEWRFRNTGPCIASATPDTTEQSGGLLMQPVFPRMHMRCGPQYGARTCPRTVEYRQRAGGKEERVWRWGEARCPICSTAAQFLSLRVWVLVFCIKTCLRLDCGGPPYDC
mmetsp:Transcript_12800/g.21345  ORF Transcript_12800/g.21345 Transcript_12800/m.21345 type:complete len:114 (-) Transcript_12800:1375-1716(-)